MTEGHQVRADDPDLRLSDVLAHVERGQDVVILRHGRPVARVVPTAPQPGSARALAAAEALLELREELAAEGVVFSREEIRAARDEGRV